MPPPYCYEYPRPAVTVDLAMFALKRDGLQVLLIRRGKDPFAGRWALPGGFLEIDEPIEDAVRREMREETGMEAAGPIALIGVFGKPGRDPRGRTISLVHGTVLRGPVPAVSGRDDAAEAAWLDPRTVKDLAFDHDAILIQALDWLARAVDEGIAGLALLPAEFGDDEVRALHRAVGRPARAAIAWRKRMRKGGRVVELEGPPHRFRAVGG